MTLMKIRRRYWVIGGVVAVALFIIAAVMTAIRIPFSSELLRQRVIATLEDRLDATVELQSLSLRLYPVVHVVGDKLTIRHKGRTDVPPLISVERLTVRAEPVELWRRRISHVQLDGLNINIPPNRGDLLAGMNGTTDPADAGPAADDEPSVAASYMKQIVISELEAPDSKLVILRSDPSKPVRTWALHTLKVKNLGAARTMPFETRLTNGVPPGEIDAAGSFGPWNRDDPGHTAIDGRFTFDDADLSVFNGIAGTLSANGTFSGALDRLEVDGVTDTPDFTVNVGGHPVPLRTRYHAIVDATNGNTTLDPVEATFLDTPLTARGGVYEVPGVKGRVVRLDVTIDGGKLDDVIRLAVNTPKPTMTGRLHLTTKFELPPGPADVVEKLRLDGRFAIERGRFTDATVQQKINELSKRASAKMSEETTPKVTSEFSGRFRLGNGTLALPDVTFDIPGAVVQLAGDYGLRRGTLAFDGNLFMDAKISQTVTGFKSLLLKMADPFFRRNGRTVVPLTVSGTRADPKFGVNVGKVFRRGDAPVPPPTRRSPARGATSPNAKAN